MRRSYKRGQQQMAAGSAAGLVAVITLMIVLYLLFVPPETREDLLDENGDENGGSHYIEDIENILTEKPGRLDYLEEDDYEHTMPSFTLYKTTDSKVLKKENAFYIKNGWFDKKFRTVSWNVDDMSNLDNILLSFTATKYRGILTVKLNNAVVFEGEITSPTIAPIELDTTSILSENTLEFTVSDVGWAFWKTNEYMIESLQITGDLTDISRQESTNVVMLSGTEYHNLDNVKLKFNPDCRPIDVGILKIYVNNHRIFSGVPDCGILNKIEFSPNYLENGENSFVFNTEKGSYLVDQIKLETELKEITYPVYYFEINESIFEEIRDDDIYVNLSVLFVDDEEHKQGEVFINGHKTGFSTYEQDWWKKISSSVRIGNNGVKIVPDHTNLDILDLKVDLWEVD